MTSAELIALLAADIAKHGSRQVRVVGLVGTRPVVQVDPRTTAVYLRTEMDETL